MTMSMSMRERRASSVERREGSKNKSSEEKRFSVRDEDTTIEDTDKLKGKGADEVSGKLWIMLTRSISLQSCQPMLPSSRRGYGSNKVCSRSFSSKAMAP